MTPFQIQCLVLIAGSETVNLTILGRKTVQRTLKPTEKSELQQLVDVGAISCTGKTNYALSASGFWLVMTLYFKKSLPAEPPLKIGAWRYHNLSSRLIKDGKSQWYSQMPLSAADMELLKDPLSINLFEYADGDLQAQMIRCWGDHERQCGDALLPWHELVDDVASPDLQTQLVGLLLEQSLLLAEGKQVPGLQDPSVATKNELLTLIRQGCRGVALDVALLNALGEWRARIGNKGFFSGSLTLIWVGLLLLARADLSAWSRPLQTWANKQSPWIKESMKRLLQPSDSVQLPLHHISEALTHYDAQRGMNWGRLWVELGQLLASPDQMTVTSRLSALPVASFLANSPDHLLMGLCQDALAFMAGQPTRTPLLAAVHRAAPWEQWLSALQPDERVKRHERLVWQLDANAQVQVRVQKLTAKGNWSSGRQIDAWGIERLDEGVAQELDHQIVLSMTHRGYFRREARVSPTTLRLLAKHPLLQNDQGDPLTLQFSAPLLLLEEHQGQWQARLDPALDLSLNAYQLVPMAADWWQVQILPDEVSKLIKGMGQMPALPEEALPRLQETLNRHEQLDWHSTHPTLRSHTRVTPWPGEPCVMLNLQGDEATLQLCSVSGNGEHQIALPLAKGSAMQRDASEPHHYWQRDMEAEERSRKQIRKELNLSKGERWHYAGAETVALLESLPAKLDKLGVGLRWHLASQRVRQLDSDALRLGISSAQEWFQIDGELQVDNHQVLALRELLRQLAGGRRYLDLGEQGRVLLSKALSEQLSLLSALLDEDQTVDQKLAYPLMRLLEQSPVKGDKAWQALSQEWQRSADCPPSLLMPLRDYQKVGVRWMADLAQHGFGACLADDMGLGKTIQALSVLRLRRHDGPALVVVPTSLLANWRDEAARFAPELNVIVLNEQNDRQAAVSELQSGDLLLTTYGLLPTHPELGERRWASIVADEAQQIKNAGTVRAKALFALDGAFRLALSGTPVENHLGELWSLFNFINPGLLGNQSRFKQRFGNAARDPVHMAQLRAVIAPFVLRRLKRQVLAELPEKTEIVHTVTLSADERVLYEATRREAVSQMQQGESPALMVLLAQLTRLRRICCSPALLLDGWAQAQSKLDAAMELIRDAIDNEHRILVFSQFVDLLSLLRLRLAADKLDYCYLDGQCSAAQRQKALQRFKSEPVPLFLISLKAGGTGLNLTEADTVIHLDPWWNPAVEDQASDRVHRIGQTEPVTVYRLVCEQTVEEKIVALHAQKRELAEGLLGEQQEVAGLDAELLRSLLLG